MNQPIVSISVLQKEVFRLKEELAVAKSDEYKEHLKWQLFELEFIVRFIKDANIRFDYFETGTIQVG